MTHAPEMRPSLGANAFAALLFRRLFIGPNGQLLDDDVPEHWPLIDATEPSLTLIADLRVSLLSVSLDEALTRAVFEIEGYPTDSPLGPVQPRVGDCVAIALTQRMHQNFRIELTHDWTLDGGVDADIGPNELLLSLRGWIVLEEKGENRDRT